jgi:hypothetical protein
LRIHSEQSSQKEGQPRDQLVLDVVKYVAVLGLESVHSLRHCLRDMINIQCFFNMPADFFDLCPGLAIAVTLKIFHPTVIFPTAGHFLNAFHLHVPGYVIRVIPHALILALADVAVGDLVC